MNGKPSTKKETTRGRSLLRVAAVYASTSLTFLGAVNLFSAHYGFSFKLFDSLLAVLLCGLPAALLFTWIHALPGRQKFRWRELAGYAVLAGIAGFAVIKIAGLPGPFRFSAATRSIAVLPFQNLGADQGEDSFSDGVTEDIITQLARISDLKVISRTSVMTYKKTAKSLPRIGEELGVSFILEGSVRRDGDRVRIVGQLIDAAKDEHLWAETYDRPLTDILAVQGEVARRIAQDLRARLTPGEKARLKKKVTVNPEAYAYYSRGREYYYKYTPEDNEQAITLFRKAVENDPSFAPAWAGLGDAFAMGWRYGSEKASLETAVEMSRKALSLDPDLAEGHKALGLALESQGNVAEGLESYYRAVALNPNYAPVVANIGSINASMGRFDEALKWLRKSVELQPGSARFYALVGLQYFNLGLDGPAGSWIERSLEFQPGFIFPEMLLATLSLYGGKRDEARESIGRILAAHPGEPNALNIAGDVELLAGKYAAALPYYRDLVQATSTTGAPGNKLAYVLLKTGDRATAERILDESLAGCQANPGMKDPWSPLRLYIAEAQAVRGNVKKALDWLEKAVDGGYSDRWISVDPLLENIRSDPRFVAITERLDKRLADMRTNVETMELDR
ncbi:MAG: tetratricopeptide repeat protein [Candidatus Aminicenantales bacterium]